MKVGQWIEVAHTLATEPSVALYGPYWQIMSETMGDTALTDVRPSDVLVAAKLAQGKALERRHGQRGVYAYEHTVAAARKLFDLAVRDQRMPANPALSVDKPRRPPSRRHALSDSQVAEMFGVASDADTVVLRFLLETGCRREGLCNLTPDKVNQGRQTVILDEKGSRQREQPVSKAMIDVLADESSALYDVTRRRLDGVWERQRRALEWVDSLGISSHWLRHTAITRMERSAGYAMAAAYAGHEAKGTTGTYVTVTVSDVARAFSRLYGEPHPLA